MENDNINWYQYNGRIYRKRRVISRYDTIKKPDLLLMLADNLSIKQIARYYSVTYSTMLKRFHALGIKLPNKAANEDRNADIKALRRDGFTLQQIADNYGISRQRVQQIVKRESQI